MLGFLRGRPLLRFTSKVASSLLAISSIACPLLVDFT
jgi:hypothetical protein